MIRAVPRLKIAVDIINENVDRRLLVREAQAMGYPWDPLLTALDMYAMDRRLVSVAVLVRA